LVSAELAFSLRVVAALLATATAVLWLRAREQGRTLRLRFVPATAHWVQTGVHAALFTAWGLHWDGVAAHAPHLLAQVLFYYAFQLLLGWSRGDEARTGFGPIPIVGSVNLFLWFRDDWFLAQFGLLAIGALAKEWVLWERDGRRTHVFNPSSFPLFFVCALLWIGNADRLTFAGDIAVSQGQVPHAWLLIFFLGLIVQARFATTLVTLSALVALYLANVAYTGVTGVYCWVDVGVPAAIFLGCNFLVTDPATSPSTARGRAAFGALYGLAVFGLYLWLREVDGPAYYDKLLCVPLLNLMVRRLDRLGGPPARRANALWVGLGAAVFAVLYATHFLGPGHPGKRVAFWEEACREGRWHACQSWTEVVDAQCHEGDWALCETQADLLIEGTHLARDLPDAGYHLALACQEGVASACQRAGPFLADGGAAALSADCDDDVGLSCLVLGTLRLEAEGPGIDAARRREIEHSIDRACTLGMPEACRFLDARQP
jgi:hypothetical protein